MNTVDTAQSNDTVAIRIAKSYDAAYAKAAERGAKAYAWASADLAKQDSKIKKGAVAGALLGIGAALGALAS